MGRLQHPREEATTFSGQRVWARLTKHYLGAGNIVAEQERDDAYHRIITPLTQRMGTTSSKHIPLARSISQWEADFKIYTIRLGTPIPPKEKLEFFRRFVAGIKEFQHVYAMNNMVKVISGSKKGGRGNDSDFEPEQVIELYKQHADIVDHDNKTDMIERRPRIEMELSQVNAICRSYQKAGYNVNVHDFGAAMNRSYDDDQWYDVMMNNRGKFIGDDLRLPPSIHLQLTPEERKLWNHFSMETKELILNARLSAGPEIQVPRRRNSSNTLSADTGHDNTSSADTGRDMASIPDNDPTVQANVHQLSMLLQRW